MGPREETGTNKCSIQGTISFRVLPEDRDTFQRCCSWACVIESLFLWMFSPPLSFAAEEFLGQFCSQLLSSSIQVSFSPPSESGRTQGHHLSKHHSIILPWPWGGNGVGDDIYLQPAMSIARWVSSPILLWWPLKVQTQMCTNQASDGVLGLRRP